MKCTGRDLDTLSTPCIAWQPASIIAVSCTFPGPHAFFGHEATTLVPFLVPLIRTRTAGQCPAIAIVGVAPPITRASGAATIAPAMSGGVPGGVTNRPSRHTGGFGARADAVAKTTRMTAAAASWRVSRTGGFVVSVDSRADCRFPKVPSSIQESPRLRRRGPLAGEYPLA